MANAPDIQPVFDHCEWLQYSYAFITHLPMPHRRHVLPQLAYFDHLFPYPQAKHVNLANKHASRTLLKRLLSTPLPTATTFTDIATRLLTHTDRSQYGLLVRGVSETLKSLLGVVCCSRFRFAVVHLVKPLYYLPVLGCRVARFGVNPLKFPPTTWNFFRLAMPSHCFIVWRKPIRDDHAF
jgi:hypothetical protein